MCKVIMLAVDGFEEIEAVTVLDILRRAGIQIDFCSAANQEYMTGSHQIVIKSDCLLSALGTPSQIARQYDGVVLPGGPGSRLLRDHKQVIEILQAFAEEDKLVAAICAAPMALERAGLLNNKRVTFYPESIENEKRLHYTEGNIERDGTIVTGKAPGAAAEFAFALVDFLKQDAVKQVKADMFF